MGRTNYSLNELLNAVTKRAFNRYTSQTVDYQHLEAATTKTGLVSNRREYSSASILADTYSLNAANIVESNYDPFLKTFTNNSIDKKTSEIGGSSNTDQFSYAITCTDDRRFLAVTSKFNNSTANEVRVYEFDETLVEKLELTSSAVLDISGNVETFDVDITDDGSETFVAKKVGTTQVVVDKFDQGLNLVSSTTLMTTSLTLTGASISVSEDGGRVAVAATSDHPNLSLFQHLFLRVHDNLNTIEYYSLYSDHEVYGTPLALMSKNGRIVVVNIGGTVITFEIPSASPSGVVSISPIQTQSISMNHFDLSHDGKVMLTHSGSDVLIYTWNGLQWKQFGQNIPTGLTQVYSSAISYYADYFVVASDDQIKVYKKKRDSAIFEQHGNTIVGDFGTTGQTIRINMLGNTVVIGNSRTDSDKGSSIVYQYESETWSLGGEINGPTNGVELGKFVKVTNNGDKLMIGSTNEVSIRISELVNRSSGWTQRGNTLTATTIDDGFGTSLSMSNDGNYLAVGIPDSTSGTQLLDGYQRGSVKIFKFSTGTWSLFGEEILGDGPVDFGKYVSISLNGTKVAIGNDKNSIVRVFTNHTQPQTQTQTVPSANVVDTATLTPQTSLLEMSDDGNRLLTSLAPTTTLQGLTVVSTPSGNKYSLDGVTQPTLRLQKGVTYTGIASTFTETGSHPLRISASPDGTHAGDSTIIASVVGGNLLIPTSASDTLYYFCGQHPNMGGTIQIEYNLSIWDKNGAGVWGKRGGLTEGDVMKLSNNGNYLSVDYGNTARLYEIDSNGQMSKIGGDITPSDVSSVVSTFRSNQPTHINTATSNSGVLNLASYVDTTRNVEISSLTWDPTQSLTVLTSQSSEITGFTVPTGSETNLFQMLHVIHGIALSGNGETLVVYDDTHFHVYTHDGSPSGNTQDGNEWTFRRTKTVSGYQNPLGAFAISYDGTLLAYKGLPDANDEIIIENAVSGTSMGNIPQTSGQGRTISFEFRNNYYLVLRFPGVYTPPISNQWVQQPEQRYHPFLFYEYVGGTMWTMVTHYPTLVPSAARSEFRIDGTNNIETFRISGDGNTIAFGASADRKVLFYRYDSDNTTSTSTLLQSGLASSAAISHTHTSGIQSQQVISGNGNVRVVAHPYNTLVSVTNTPLYSGDVNIYEKNQNGDWPSTPSATFDVGFLGNFFSNSASIGISEDGTRVIIGTGLKVFVVHKSGGVWSQLGSYITTFSGSRVAISGDGTTIFNYTGGSSLDSYRFVSGSWVTYLRTLTTDSAIIKIDSSSNGDIIALSKNNSNKVYNYTTIQNWGQLGSSIAGSIMPVDRISVGLSSNGSRVVVGDPGYDTNRGRVRVFDWNSVTSQWDQAGADIIGSNNGDLFGFAVAMSSNGSRIAASALLAPQFGVPIGSVGVYELNSGTGQWGFLLNHGGTLPIMGNSYNDEFGYSLAMSSDGNRLIVGAREEDENPNIDVGKAFVYTWNGYGWGDVPYSWGTVNSQIPIIGQAAGDRFGHSVAMSSDGLRVAIGALYNDNNNFSNSGHVRVFDRNGGWNHGSWVQVGGDIEGQGNQEYFGYSVAMSSDGSRLAIGAIGGAGLVRVYDLDSTLSPPQWVQVGGTIQGYNTGDNFGYSVAMSSDGSRIVIGARLKDVGGGFTQVAGQVRIYDLDSTLSPPQWAQVGWDINGGGQNYKMGDSVAISSDGLTVAAGEPGAGRGRIFQYGYDVYQLTSTHTGPMIDISNDGTVVTSSDGPSSFNSTTIFALSGDGTKLVAFWNDSGNGYLHKIQVWNKVNSTWTSTHQKRLGHLLWDGGSTTSIVDLSINNDGSIVGVTLANHHVLFYDVGVFDMPNGWTSHSSITNSGNVLEDFGSVVDLSNDGNTVLVGAPGDGTSSYRGYIKVYDYASGAWTARSTITTTNSDSSSTTGSTTVSIGYRFGKSTSLSSNGDRVSYIEDKETVTATTTLVVSTTDTIAMSGSNTFDYDTAINTTHNGGDFGGVTYTTAFQQTTPYYYYSMVQFSGSDSGIWLPVTFDRSWSVNFTWWGNSSLDFVFYAPNQPSTKDHTQHGGYRIIETPTQRSIVSPTGVTLTFTSVSYSTSHLQQNPVYGNTGWPYYNSYVRYVRYVYSGQRTVNITYSNGTITVAVPGDTSTQYTFTGSDLTAQQALWGTQTYIGICPFGGQHVFNINVSWDNYTSSTTSNTTRISELSVRDIAGGTVSNPIATTADPNRPVVNFSEGRELSAISMSKDGTRIGVRAATGTYDALMKHLETVPNGWTLRGSIIQFTAPGSIASSSVRALVNSSDGNTIAFRMNTTIKVYGFSNNAWSQLGSDIVPGVTNPNEISIDLSSDGTTLAVLIDRTTSDPAICKVFTFSSGSWSQSGSSIEFRPTGTNKVKISGDGTTIALGNNAPDSPYPFNVIRVYRKNQDWELISPTMMVNKTPTNLFGAGLNLTNNGTKLATFNTSGAEFYTFSTQTETVTRHSFQYLNDITVSGATIDMGDIRFSDSSDRLFVMSGTGHVRVYDNTHTEEVKKGGTLGVRNFSITKDGSYMVLTNNTGLTKVFSRNETSWSQVGNNITANMSVGSVTTDIKSGGNSIVLLGSSDDLQLHKYENGSWSQASTSTGTRGTSVFISDSDDIIVGDNTNAGRVKTFEIKDVFQDISFTAPTLKLNGDEYIRLNSGSTYVENGATVSTSAAITPAVKISGSVLTGEPRVYTIKYEVEDLQRKKADPIIRSIEVIPEVSPIKLEGDSVIYHTQGTSLQDPGVTASVPVNVYHASPGTPGSSAVVVSGFPNFLTETALGEYKIFYTNDSPDIYLRPSPMVTRSVFVRARPVLTRIGPSIVYNPLNQTYVDSGVTFTQSGEASPTVSVSFNAPRIGVSETQTVTYTAKDQFGIEAIPITRQVIVRKRPTITTSGTLYRILNDPISIPAPTVFPETLSGSLQTSNNINRNQLGSYSISYNVTDGDGISANTTRQQYEVGSYGKVTFSQIGTVSAFSRDGRSFQQMFSCINLEWTDRGRAMDPSQLRPVPRQLYHR